MTKDVVNNTPDAQRLTLPVAPAELPRWCIASLFIICGLLSVVTVGGILDDQLYSAFTTSLHTAEIQGQDVVLLCIVMPVLLLSLRRLQYATLGHLAVIAGVLGFIGYVQLMYTYGGMYNRFFLLYSALLSLSVIALMNIVAHAIRRVPAGTQRFPGQAVVIFVSTVAVIRAAAWMALIFQSTLENVIANASIILVTELVLVFPLSIMVVIGLVKRLAWSAFAAAGLLVFGTILGLSILAGQVSAYKQGLEPDWSLLWRVLAFTAVAYSLARHAVSSLDFKDAPPRPDYDRRGTLTTISILLVTGIGCILLQLLDSQVLSINSMPSMAATANTMQTDACPVEQAACENNTDPGVLYSSAGDCVCSKI